MAAAEGTTTAKRSGFVPACATLVALVACALLAACLNPMPDENPSANDLGSRPAGGGSGGSAAQALPDAPGDDAEGPGDLNGAPGAPATPGAGDGSAGTGGELPPSGAGAGGVDVPDAGADAGTFDEDGSAEGESEP